MNVVQREKYENVMQSKACHVKTQINGAFFVFILFLKIIRNPDLLFNKLNVLN